MNNINIDKKDFEKYDLKFRRMASNLLRSSERDFLNNVKKFIDYVESCDLILEFINRNNSIKYDIPKIINHRSDGYKRSFEVGYKQEEAISMTYQLLKYCSLLEGREAFSIYFMYNGEDNYNEMVKSFNEHISKILIDNILMYLEDRRIDMKEDGKITINVNGQGGQVIYGTDNSNIVATQNNNFNSDENLLSAFEILKNELLKDKNIDSDEKEEIVESVELAIETCKSNKPKRTIIKTAISTLKKLIEVSGLGITLVHNANIISDNLSKLIK